MPPRSRPYRRRKKKYTYKRKKRYKKKNAMSRIQYRILRSPNQLIPDALYCPVKAVLSNTSIFTTAAFTKTIQLSANSMDDIMQGNGTLQPYGFDQIGNLYRKYQVLGVRMKMRISTKQTSGVHIAVAPTITTTTPTTFEQVAAQPYSKTAYTSIDLDKAKIRIYISTKKIFQQRYLDDDSYSGQTPLAGVGATAPSKLWFYNIFFRSSDATTNLSNDVLFEFIFYVKFFSRRQLALSADE